MDSARFTEKIGNRKTIVKFIDISTINRNRIIYINWYLEDNYSSTSMSEENRNKSFNKEWLLQDKDTEIETLLNSKGLHKLTQEIHWDDGFEEKIFIKEYLIECIEGDINPDFNWFNPYLTGPNIRITDVSTNDSYSKLLSFDLYISDKDNNNIDSSVIYSNQDIGSTLEHEYKSASNSPFEEDNYNKLVSIRTYYDNGWDYCFKDASSYILVKPNRITQDFTTNPIRHDSDLETSDLVITGNNPIEFKDNSTGSRFIENVNDNSFIKKVEYIIEEECTQTSS